MRLSEPKNPKKWRNLGPVAKVGLVGCIVRGPWLAGRLAYRTKYVAGLHTVWHLWLRPATGYPARPLDGLLLPTKFAVCPILRRSLLPCRGESTAASPLFCCAGQA